MCRYYYGRSIAGLFGGELLNKNLGVGRLILLMEVDRFLDGGV